MGFVIQARSGDRAVRKLGTYARIPKPGPYAAFHHQTEVLTRIADILLLVRHLVASRKHLYDLNQAEWALRPRNHPAGTPYPLEIQRVMRRANRVSNSIRLDFEALYVFGTVLLDQWAILVSYFFGIPNPEESTFQKLVQAGETDAGALGKLWADHKREMIWLDCHLRAHRNRFIIHVDRPWQKGTTHSLMGNDFRFFIPSPPGWLNDSAWENRIREVTGRLVGRSAHFPAEIEKQLSGPLLKFLFDRIGDIGDPKDRAAIMQCVRQSGVETNTFQVVAQNLLVFITDGTNKACELVSAQPERINLGAPSRA